MFWVPRLAARSTAGDPAARPEGGRSTAGAVGVSTGQGRGGGSDTTGAAVGLATSQARGGGTCVVDFATGEGACPAVVVDELVCWTRGDVDGRGADDWARQASGSNQGNVTAARMTVNLPIRSIGPGSFPFPPDRNLRRSESGRTGRQMLYRLIPMRMLMTNAAILSPPF